MAPPDPAAPPSSPSVGAAARPVLPHWQAALLRGLVLVGAVFAFGGALTLFSLGLLANGRGIAALNFSWTMFGFSLAAGLAQASLSWLGCRSAWRWIGEREGAQGD
ncbi:hypothetical protein [Novosphingobium sp.]|uniref:hypothetical protein n=1 Tax=Novosphingobium sp. TaxID=1874826 RepID=UPI00261D1B35|nr:hypothetical protein [Novosphingobium sp.]